MGSEITASAVERQSARVATWILLIVSVAVLVAIGISIPWLVKPEGWASGEKLLYLTLVGYLGASVLYALSLALGDANLAAGDDHLAEMVERLRAGPNWNDMLIIVISDENGGAFDHMGPPKGDRFGPGTRIPAIIISPFARKEFVDHTVYDTTSILRTIEERFGLTSLSKRDAAANDFRNALEPAR